MAGAKDGFGSWEILAARVKLCCRWASCRNSSQRSMKQDALNEFGKQRYRGVSEPREAFGVRRIPPLSDRSAIHKTKAPEYGALQTLRELVGVGIVWVALFSTFEISEGALVPEKVQPAVRDRQD